MGALKGIKVLEFTHYIAGPYCGQVFADHGADVIKVEPLHGDPSRYENPMHNGKSLYFPTMNRNKKSISLDLKSSDSNKILKELIKESDIIVTNYATGVPERLGFDYETVKEINEKIIMIHITGFGLTGPYKNKNAYDGIIQAMSGVADLSGEPGRSPMKAGIYVADHVAAIQGVVGGLLALHSRQQTGQGQLVDIGMLDSMVSMLGFNLTAVNATDHVPTRIGNRSLNVFATIFPTKDGYVNVSPLTDKMWESFCTIIGRPEWLEDSSPYSKMDGRIDHYDNLEALISEWTIKRPTNEVVQLFEDGKVPAGAVRTMKEVVNDEHLQGRGMIKELEIPGYGTLEVPGVPVHLDATPSYRADGPPDLGQHTEEVLKSIGYSTKKTNKLSTAGIINCGK